MILIIWIKQVLLFISLSSFLNTAKTADHHLPDLVVESQRFRESLRTDILETHDPCFIEEGCVTGLGDRQVLRFITEIKNIGEEDFYVGRPPDYQHQENEIWEWDQCHNHWHYEGYAQYLLFNQRGESIPIGFKTGFCLMDSTCPLGIPQYSCSNQGISANCSDVYTYGIDCQWVDVTDVPDGIYTLAIRINWTREPDANGNYEEDYTNNESKVCFQLSRNEGGRHQIAILSDPSCHCPDADQDGYCSVDDCDDTNAAIPSSQACPTNGGSTSSTGTSGGGSTSSPTTTNVFVDFPWLSSIVNPNACTNETVQVFTFPGGYDFIQVVGPTSTKLYFQDGTFYCENRPGYDCLAVYNLTNRVNTWQCGQTQTTTTDNSVEENNQVFIDFPWLLDLFLPTTCIKVYTFGIYRFIHLQESTESYGRLYFENGVFYCSDSPNYDCRANYGLDQSDLVAIWNCPGSLQDSQNEASSARKINLSETALQNKYVALPTDFRVYPNPATNQINLGFGNNLISENREVQIINHTGQIIHQENITNSPTFVTIDLLGIPNGFYLVKLRTNEEQLVKKLLVSK